MAPIPTALPNDADADAETITPDSELRKRSVLSVAPGDRRPASLLRMLVRWLVQPNSVHHLVLPRIICLD
ncbi:hypothetical protein HZH68_010192 [Vespula germanica]|uniref:Uncharacterized protein n=2 Tax=Vespula TaxID=7451 RepID=A0A834JR37_VESGE|nr:hypothetical protein HZH68_010192 [Vespula germanica]KAF7416510.1 hypothetical protein H0235_011041 [Vespula pensylvanica]